MAKTLEELLKEELGNLVFQLCVASAEMGKLREENAKLKEAQAKEEPDGSR